MLWLIFGCGEEITPEPPPSTIEEEAVVLGQEVQALWTPIEDSKSKLSRHRYLAWDRNLNGTIDDNSELISVFDTDGTTTFSDGFEMLSHYFDSDKNGVLENEELSELLIWTDVEIPTLYNQLNLTETPILQALTDIGIKRINLENPEDNAPLTWTELCVIRTDEAGQPLWLPPNAGPVAEGCDQQVLNCHEPLSIIDYINNDGEAIDEAAADQLPYYPMSQPLESCFPGPSHYLDIETYQEGDINSTIETTEPNNEESEEANPDEEDSEATELTDLQIPVDSSQALDFDADEIRPLTEDSVREFEQDTGLDGLPPSEAKSDSLIHSVKRFAQIHRFGPSSSMLTVQTFKDGNALGASFAHNHIILARAWSGSIRWHPTDPNQCLIEFRISVTGLDPDPPDLRKEFGLEGVISEEQRGAIKDIILSEPLLDARTHPNIIFQAYDCSGTDGIIEVTGILTIRGVEREIRFPINVDLDNGLHVKGFFFVLHEDFKLEPYQGLLGTTRNRQPLKFSFELNSLPE